MKQIAAITLALALFLTACAPAVEPAPMTDAPAEPSDMLSGAEELEAPTALSPSELVDDNRIIVMDAMLFRGTLEEVTAGEDGSYELVLRRAEGTNFSYDSLRAVTDEYTRSNFELSEMGELAAGRYVEIYYGGSTDGDPVRIIGANLLPDADLCNYNGEVIRFEREEDGSGLIELKDRGGDGTTIFHFDASCNFYLNDADLAPGSELNIFHSGRMTRSIPPQGNAIEVRKFSVGEE